MQGPAVLGGRYEISDVLGSGGMAEVRDGWDTRLNRAVAIKLLHPGLAAQPDARLRFEVEACAAAALNHPNIVAVYDIGDQAGTPFIVMERLPGDTLGDRIALGPMPQSVVHTVLASLLSALAAAHCAGILHRDIKPGNILLTLSGAVKLADFGIAKSHGSAHTTTGQIMGTLAYLSPARLTGDPASAVDDLYAVGVVGYEALTGQKPFPQEDIAPLARAILEESPPPLAAIRPDVDPQLADIVERAMSRDPERRFTDAESMRAALSSGYRGAAGPAVTKARTAFGLGTSVAPRSEVASSTASRRTPRVRARQALGAGAVLIGLACATLVFALDPSPTTPLRAPEPVSISTPEVVSPHTETPLPVVAAPAPSPAAQLPESAAQPMIEQATNNPGRANGSGHGNGHSGKKPK